MGIEVNGLLGLVWLIILIWAVIQVLRSSASGLHKILWIALIVILPVIGLIIYLIMGPRSG